MVGPNALRSRSESNTSTNYGSGITTLPNGRRTYLPDDIAPSSMENFTTVTNSDSHSRTGSGQAPGHSRHISISTVSGVTIPMSRLSNNSETTLYHAYTSRPDSLNLHYPPLPHTSRPESVTSHHPPHSLSASWRLRYESGTTKFASEDSLSSRYTHYEPENNGQDSGANTRVNSLMHPDTQADGKHGKPDHGKDEIDMEKMAAKGKRGPPGKGGPPPGMGGPPGMRGPKDPNIVEWDGPDDPENPMNFPRWKKWMITVAMGMMTFCITFASSVFSTATEATAAEFGISPEAMTLGTSLFVLGFAFGPCVWGPFSEVFGRKIPLFTGFFIFAIFQIPVAVAQNVQTIMLCRFLGGLFGSAPLGIVGGAMVDFWEPLDRGIAICIFSAATFLGPVAGPIAGGFITMSSLTWRWTEYLTMIMGFSFGLIGLFAIPETFAPVLLSRKAKKMRYQTLNWALHARSDEQQVVPKELVTKFLFKPFKMLFLDPILLLITLYMSLIYGVLYLLFVAYPIAFSEKRGWNLGVGALPFAAVTIGVLFGALLIVFHSKTRYARLLKENGSVVPEERLIPMMVGGVIFPAGLFWFAWTSSPQITWVPQVLSGIFIGGGVLLIFLQGLNYIVDCYKWNSASAIAGNTFCRSLVGAGFPLFATAMFHTLGVDWAASLLGFLAAALAPVPFLFFVYGKKIRNLSKFSPTGGPPGGQGGPPGGGPPGGGPPGGGPPGGGPSGGGPPGGGPPGGMGGGPPGGMGGGPPAGMSPGSEKSSRKGPAK